jgi:uncharacterized protein YcbX
VPARVAWIHVAPVKSLALVARDEVTLGPAGVRQNRRFHVVDERGVLINGKRVGRLVQVVPAHDEEAGTLSLRFPDGRVVEDRVVLGGRIDTTVHRRVVPARELDGPWSDALSAFAGRPLRLVMSDDEGAAVDRTAAATVTVVSVAALEALAGAGGVEGPVDGRRFRMLFGVDGVDAHAEDGWLNRRIRIGDAVVVPRGNVGRCAITTQHPDTGEPDLDTLHILKRYRGAMPATEQLPFGVYGEVAQPGRVRVGDSVEVGA